MESLVTIHHFDYSSAFPIQIAYSAITEIGPAASGLSVRITKAGWAVRAEYVVYDLSGNTL